jgi:hypothetical protein
VSDLLETLEAFNRKERFFLFSYATGNSDRGLRLSDDFRNDLGKAMRVDVPPGAKGYIDYHIDWLHAAVLLARDPGGPMPRPNWKPGTSEPALKAEPPWVSTGNQEDLDLVVAFESGAVTWLLLIEAKAETNWTNEQVRSKAGRLRRIFGSGEVDSGSLIQPRFCLMSRQPPVRLTPRPGEAWPAWMVSPSNEEGTPPGFAWLKLAVPPGRKKVTGCRDHGAESKDRKYWRVTDVRAPSGAPQTHADS